MYHQGINEAGKIFLDAHNAYTSNGKLLWRLSLWYLIIKTMLSYSN